MIKKTIFVLFIFLSSFAFSQQASNFPEDEKIQFAMLMNQIQYTTSNIMYTRDRDILSQEFDFIINQIDKSKLYDNTIKNSYNDLLDTLSTLKLSENEKEFVIETSKIERKQAYTKAFSSFGSVFTGGFSPASLVTSLAYAGISAGLNIMDAKYQSDNKLRKQLFRLEQKDIATIDGLRKNIFDRYTTVITTYKIPVKYEISESEMNDFIKQLAEKKTIIPISLLS